MAYYTLNRDLLLGSTMGYLVEFKKDEPGFIPTPMHREVEALGAEPVEAPPESDVDLKDATPKDPKERAKAVREAIEALTLRNRREDFTAGGMPTQKALSEYLGWSPSVKERDIIMANMAKGE